MVRTLLLDSFVPPCFWGETLSTVVHLINRLPSPMLNHVSHVSKLFGHSHLYYDLRTFDCVCFVLFISLLMNDISLLLSLVSVFFLVMLSLTRIMFVMIPMLVVYEFPRM